MPPKKARPKSPSPKDARWLDFDPFLPVERVLACGPTSKGLTVSLSSTEAATAARSPAGQGVFWLRAAKVGSSAADACDFAWPATLAVLVNRKTVLSVTPPAPNQPPRRDKPLDLSPHLKPGDNVVTLRCAAGWVAGVVLAGERAPGELQEQVQRAAPVAKLAAKQKRGTDIECLSSSEVKLTCPVGLIRMDCPVRGRQCAHAQCFDLEAYVVANQRTRFNARWKCPVCGRRVLPADLGVDKEVAKLLVTTQKDRVTTSPGRSCSPASPSSPSAVSVGSGSTRSRSRSRSPRGSARSSSGWSTPWRSPHRGRGEPGLWSTLRSWAASALGFGPSPLRGGGTESNPFLVD